MDGSLFHYNIEIVVELSVSRHGGETQEDDAKGSVAKSGYLVTCLCDLPRGVEA